MKTQGLRLLGWALHVAFFAAWIQVALIMERQMHDEPRPGAASSPEAAIAGAAAAPKAAVEAAAQVAPQAAAAAEAGVGRVKTSARNARDLKARAG